jgi:hypothetical protein
MSSPGGLTPEEEFVERVKSARRGTVVLKTRLVSLRSDLPDTVVLAFEGDDDKIVYGQWIRRVCPQLHYEPFPCGGKREARELKNALGRDLAQLGDNVFFLVDRDYDDLAGFDNIDRVFITDMYAVENYIVDDEVLDNLLRDDFPCHARPDARRLIVEAFRKDYQDFLRHTAAVNERLYIARRSEIRLTKRLPTSLRHLAVVEIGNVTPAGTKPEELVLYEREPTPEEVIEFAKAFKELNPNLRYRGKFAIKFFHEWLKKLSEEYLAGEAGAFGRRMPEGAIRCAEFVLSNFASKSRLPNGLATFINGIC